VSVKILTDSTSYLTEALKSEFDIRIVSLYVSFGESSFKEVEIGNDEFYQMMDQQGIPTSSQPSVGELYNEMVNVVEKGNSLCCIFISSKMSGTLSVAELAKKMVLEKYEMAEIEIVDSLSNSMQLGYAVLQAARAAQAGQGLVQVKEAALQNIQRSRFIFAPDNLDYLKKGGRIGGASSLIGNLFKIIPILTVEQGAVIVLEKVRRKDKAVLLLFEKLLKDIQEFGLGEVCVQHINCLHEAKALAQRITEHLKIKVIISDIGPVIGLHVGPGAIGIAYYTQKDLR
jgi:DegV family protein with EDD domain